MADSSKAEKLAAARKKLKLFQQKNKDTNLNSARSTPPSIKSHSPSDAIFTSKEQQSESNTSLAEENKNVQNNGNCFDEFNKNTASIDIGSINQDLSSSTYFQQSQLNTGSNFFDNILQPTSVNENTWSSSPQQNQSVMKSINDLNHHQIPAQQNNHLIVDSTPQNVDEGYHIRLYELESIILNDRKNNDELQRKLHDSHNHILSLQGEIKSLNEGQGHKVAHEVLQLNETIKIQIQTIEILVSEKSGLQKELMQLQDENKAIISQCEELSGRLKASRTQLQKSEKELSDRLETKAQHNGILKKLENELMIKEATVQEALHNLNSAQNVIRELEKRVEVGQQNQFELKKQLEEKEKQYSMAQIKLAQLGSEGDADALKEMETLKSELDKSRKDAENIWEEGKRTESELRQYIANVNSQVLQANAKCERTEKDREELTKRIENLVKHVSELEKQLQREKCSREAMNEGEEMNKLKEGLEELQQTLTIKDKHIKDLEMEYHIAAEKLSEAERWKDNIPDMGLLQAAMESDRVAASRAVEQNNALKEKLHDLEEYIIRINNGKLELTEESDKYKHMAGEYRLQLEKYKTRQEMRMVDCVTQTNYIKKSESVTQTTYHDIAHMMDPHEPVPVETLVLIEGKLKRTMDRVAELSDEKHRLEHLVLQLQSETETIGEYVTLYQNQRSLLKEKSQEKERQMIVISKEREELKSKLDEINILLQLFPHNPDVEDTTCKISSLLGEIQSSTIIQDPKVEGTPSTFHPCLLCSGKLINV